MTLAGHSLIAGEATPGTSGTAHGINPATNEQLEPAYTLISDQQLRTATEAAADAFDSFSTLEPEQHARFLEAIAENIEAIGDDLIERTSIETGLGLERLRGERARTTGQLRLFADVVRHGDFRGVRIDPAIPDRTPLPRADIRQRQIPLGPVAVFGASNFPLAFSVAGGDTASAFAAGCPVIVKAHNAHPEPPNSSARPSPRPSPTSACTPASSPSSTAPAPASARPSWPTPPSKPSASPVPAPAAPPSCAPQPHAPNRSRSTPKCPRSTPCTSSPAPSKATSRPSPGSTSDPSPAAPDSCAPPPDWSSSRKATPATASPPPSPTRSPNCPARPCSAAASPPPGSTDTTHSRQPPTSNSSAAAPRARAKTPRHRRSSPPTWTSSSPTPSCTKKSSAPHPSWSATKASKT
ncbi:aldehyde dehydrogenase [Arthrobacter globiformis NBRC 12137]|uniref:Aldehyde dehydrogenase n=1 Tax=Arthrobacter globiformis (strain ATCC 8010 / DSM 20124 / JCM 1332 / NBRC 12137 / NCIMB 8907 / NRRL B-2979 / 168) TaxID=1077972 RepID=H0QJX1_ARTG1|nr:aldehyde dehydrogenase [Arthrobacter globiformis NBRC 12137]